MTEETQTTRKVIIIGGGIAAHAAAVYAARANMQPLVLSAPELDQLSYTTEVENYPGFPEGIQGPDLVNNAKKQAQKFGAEYKVGKVDAVAVNDDKTLSVTVKDTTYTALSVIIATGASARMLGVPGEQHFFGKGVSSCAVCDAAFYKDKEVVIIGGGDSAMEETLILSRFAKKITVIHRRDEFRASKIMQKRVKGMTDKVYIKWNTVVTEVLGEKQVTGVKLKDVQTGKEETFPTNGVFLAIGHIPNVSFVKDIIELDEGYIKTDELRATSVPGIFAAGDVQDRIFKQAITSAGSGCQAALSAERYVEKLEAEREE